MKKAIHKQIDAHFAAKSKQYAALQEQLGEIALAENFPFDDAGFAAAVAAHSQAAAIKAQLDNFVWQ